MAVDRETEWKRNAKVGEKCVDLLKSVGKEADEEAISRALRDVHDVHLRRCQPSERAVACALVGDWLSSQAMATMGACPCWELPPLPTLSLLFYLVSQSLTFYLRAQAEASRTHWQLLHPDLLRRWPYPELQMRRLLPRALLESRSLRAPALHVPLLSCMCDSFAHALNVNMYKSKCGAEAHLMLAELIFKGQADVSIAVETDISHQESSSDVKFADCSSNMEVVDSDMKLFVCVEIVDVTGSSKTEGSDGKRASFANVTPGVVDVDASSESKGLNASSHVKDVDVQRREDTDIKGASNVCSFCQNGIDSHPGHMKRAAELEQCLRTLEVAKKLVPSHACFLKWKISVLHARIALAASSLCPKLYHYPKMKLPFVSESSGGQDEGASYVFGSMLKNQIAPLLKGNNWLYLIHIGITMSLLLQNRKTR